MRNVYRHLDEYAWPRDEALQIIDWLLVNGYKIIGIDTWLPTRPGPTPLIHDWSPDVIKSSLTPEDPKVFIATFQTPDQTVNSQRLNTVFNIWAK